MIKFIHLDYRKPRNKEEAECFGITQADIDMATVHINSSKNRNSYVFTDTFFHEMAHVFFAFHSKDRQMSKRKEEKLATSIGKLCAEALK